MALGQHDTLCPAPAGRDGGVVEVDPVIGAAGSDIADVVHNGPAAHVDSYVAVDGSRARKGVRGDGDDHAGL